MFRMRLRHSGPCLRQPVGVGVRVYCSRGDSVDSMVDGMTVWLPIYLAIAVETGV